TGYAPSLSHVTTVGWRANSCLFAGLASGRRARRVEFAVSRLPCGGEAIDPRVGCAAGTTHSGKPLRGLRRKLRSIDI
ncbi:MAG: hypothetical protein LBF83_01485, partial [Spirochaetaceae bacterium]|nr:hypothetical protein [Spirochaetaceae bacterium]